MSRAACPNCDEVFDAAAMPGCPPCLAEAWLATPTFIRPKHDPRLLPLRWESYRSVLTPNFANDPGPHLVFAARNGTWYRDNHYEMYVHMTHEPLGRSAGGGIPEGKTSPEHGLDSLLIAEADSEVEAHGFAVSRTTFEQQVRAGEFEALPHCNAAGCNNLALLRASECAEHQTPRGAAKP
jgi:hypothetical protein